MKEFFEDRKLSGLIRLRLKTEKELKIWEVDKLKLTNHIVKIVENYYDRGYILSLRQLYYQLVARDIIPNHIRVYKKLSLVLDDIRYSGKLDWDALEDRGRVPYLPYWVEDVSDALEDTVDTYRLDRQLHQDTLIEVWTEKDAISSILRKITSKYHVRLSINKGYTSSSAIYKAYKRIAKALVNGQKIKILYLGDHDPSGLDMVRDIKERLIFMLTFGDQYRSEMKDVWLNHKYSIADLADHYQAPDLLYLEQEKPDLTEYRLRKLHRKATECIGDLLLNFEERLVVEPIALTWEQIQHYNPPPNPAKISDPRATAYINKFGSVSWEVDALDPDVLEELLSDSIESNIDLSEYYKMVGREEEDKKVLKTMRQSYVKGLYDEEE